MRLATAENLVEIGQTAGDTSQFNIAMNAKMVKILSDMLYKDKIGSLVREISCNAYDSHVAAGKPEAPFYIHLPTLTEPWFSVRDEGIGMSDQTIRETFTIYGESTKDLSDDAIGAFGLGCKTPFAYRDQFTITSIYDGTKTIYSAVINTSGIPELIPQAIIPCNAHNGIEIMVSVDSSDFEDFEYAVQYQLKFFKVKPIIENRKSFEFNFDANTMIDYSDENVTVFSNVDYTMRKIFIVQGGVGYPLDKEEVTRDNHPIYDYLQNRGSIIEFPIGDIDVVASRENVAYTDRTKKNINDRLAKIAKEMIATIVQELEATDNFWQRACAFNEKDSFIRSLIVRHNKDLITHPSFYIDNNKINISHEVSEIIRNEHDVILRKRSVTPGSDNITYYRSAIEVHKYIVFCVQDTTLRSKMRVLDFIKDNDHQVVPFVFMHSNKEFFTDERIKEYSELLGDVNIIRVSSMPDNNAPVKGAKSTRKYTGPYTSYIYGGKSLDPSYWHNKITEFDENETYHYVVTRRRNLINFYDEIQHIRLLVADSNNKYNIVAINEMMHKKKVLKGKLPGKWIPVAEEKDRIIKQIEPLKPAISTAFFWGRMKSFSHDIIKEIINHGVMPNKECAKYLTRLADIANRRVIQYDKSMEQMKSKNEKLFNIALDHCEMDILNKIDEMDIKQQLQDKFSDMVNIEYPMLQYVRWNIKGKEIADYVKAMDLLDSVQ